MLRAPQRAEALITKVCDPRMLTLKMLPGKNFPQYREGRRMKNLQFCLAMLCTLILAVGATAQTQNGQFTGTVTDPSGAAIADAKVTITNLGTNLSFTATTNPTGMYVARELPVGTYKITTEAKGFKTVTNTGLALNAG